MSFLVKGGMPLYGSVSLQGAKNAALPILFATLLCKEPVILRRVPHIGDVEVALSLLKAMGVKVTSVKDGLLIDSRGASPPNAAMRDAGRIRASSYLLGASLSAFGEGDITLPGGCDLGERPLDLHERALAALGGVTVKGRDSLGVRSSRLMATAFRLPFPSVGATVNFLLAALGAEGESRLYGYAAEPHVMDLVGFLRQMGADIRANGDCLRIRGGTLHGGSYTVISDAMEGGTYLLAAAVAGGDVTVSSLLKGELSALRLAFMRMGIETKEKEGSIRILSSGASHYKAIDLTAAPYPAFPTDLHPPFAALLCASHGEGSVTDTVWRDRFQYVDEMRKMGACITRAGNRIETRGGRLRGNRVRATDLRGGAALLVAALGAEGDSVIENTDVIKRGYADVVEKLRSLGAIVEEG